MCGLCAESLVSVELLVYVCLLVAPLLCDMLLYSGCSSLCLDAVVAIGFPRVVRLPLVLGRMRLLAPSDLRGIICCVLGRAPFNNR